jgi:hypothetical protein
MKQKNLLPEYLGLPLIVGCSGDSLEAGKTLESPEAKTAARVIASHREQLFANAVSDSRNRYFEKLLSPGHRQNRSRVMFGLNDLEGQLRRLQVFLDYCDNTKQELETLNLVAQRNIPVTFTSPAADVINDTLEPPSSRGS